MLQISNKVLLVIVVAVLLAPFDPAESRSLDDSLGDIENRWAVATRESNRRNKNRELKGLLDDVRALHAQYPDRPETAAWHGIVARSYLDVRSGISSMSLAREARDALLAAESLNPLIYGGKVYANLGALYANARTKFGGFGSTTRGIGYFWKAIVVDPDGVDSNYLYALLLLDEKNYARAREALIRASSSPTVSAADQVHKAAAAKLLASIELK